jgi:hypothetical protein
MLFSPDEKTPRFYYVIPKARPVPIKDLEKIYDRQSKIMFAA